jgi:hypothetical protein
VQQKHAHAHSHTRIHSSHFHRLDALDELGAPGDDGVEDEGGNDSYAEAELADLGLGEVSTTVHVVIGDGRASSHVGGETAGEGTVDNGFACADSNPDFLQYLWVVLAWISEKIVPSLL